MPSTSQGPKNGRMLSSKGPRTKLGYDNHVLSLRAISLDCHLIPKRERMTMFHLRVPSDLIVSGWQRWCRWPCIVFVCHQTWLSQDSKKCVDDHVLSSRSSDWIVSGLQNGEWPCLVSACHRTWLSLDSKKASDDNAFSPRAIRLDFLWIAKRVWLTMFCL